MTTMRTLESGVSGGAIWRGERDGGCGGERHGQAGSRALPPLRRRIGPPARLPGLFGWFSQPERPPPCSGRCWQRCLGEWGGGVRGLSPLGQHYLDRGTCEPGELLDVLALLADDGTDRLRGDEDVHRLLLRRLWVQRPRSGLSVPVQGSAPPRGSRLSLLPSDAHAFPKGAGLSHPNPVGSEPLFHPVCNNLQDQILHPRWT